MHRLQYFLHIYTRAFIISSFCYLFYKKKDFAVDFVKKRMLTKLWYLNKSYLGWNHVINEAIPMCLSDKKHCSIKAIFYSNHQISHTLTTFWRCTM